MQIWIFFKSAWEHFNLWAQTSYASNISITKEGSVSWTECKANTTALPSVLNGMFNGSLGSPAALCHVDSADTGTDPIGKRKEVVM